MGIFWQKQQREDSPGVKRAKDKLDNLTRGLEGTLEMGPFEKHELRKDGWRFGVELTIILSAWFIGGYVALTTSNPEIRTAATSSVAASLAAILQRQSPTIKS